MMETEYYPLREEEVRAQVPLSQAFSWLNLLILAFPMWTKRLPDSGTSRSSVLSFTIVTLAVLGNLYHGGEACVYYLWIEGKDNFIYHVIYAVAETFETISRFCSLYYFYRHFNFPWNRSSDHMDHANTIQRFKWLLICTLAIILISDSFMSVHYVITDLSIPNYMSPVATTSVIVGRIFTVFPIYITFATAAVIFLKYHQELKRVTDTLRDDERAVDFANMLDKYVFIEKEFKLEYPSSLQWCLFSYLFVIALDLWIGSYEILTFQSFEDFVDLLDDLCMLIMYFMSASLVAEAYTECESALDEYGKTHKRSVDYVYFVSYVTRHPLVIKIGQTVVTKKSAATIATVFACAKLIGYSLYAFTV